MIFVEIGNSTLKLARPSDGGEFAVERLNDPAALVSRVADESGPILIAPVAEGKASEILSLLSAKENVQVLRREDFASFIGDSYDTPETLGLDRILNLFALSADGIVISCGTAITIDALSSGRPFWGAIMPGFTTAAEGLSRSAPALPVVSGDDLRQIPARTSREAVANGVILGTVLAASQLASLLAERCGLSSTAPLILTGGDAELMASLFRSDHPLEVRPGLIFEGIGRKAGS